MEKRLDIHVTFYRGLKNEDGRVWFTWDGTEVAAFGDMSFWLRVEPLSAQLQELDPDQEPNEGWEQAIAVAQAEGMTDVSRFYQSIGDYLALPINEAVASADPFVRGLAMLDRRLGKRRLASAEFAGEINPFVRRLCELRIEAEGLTHPTLSQTRASD